MTPTGFETLSPTTNPDKALRQAPSPGAAKSGAILPENTLSDPRLARLVALWPRLSETTRQAIMEIVSTARSACLVTP
jgi:hypothetical protein